MTVSSPAAFRFRVQHHKSLTTKDLRIKNVVEYSIAFPQFPTQSILSVYSEDEYYIPMHIEKKFCIDTFFT